MAGKIRVVVAKPGLDGHDRGAKIIARALRDAGMEVIYTGLHQTPEQIVETAIQEDADAVGISILSGAHMTLVPRIIELLRAEGADDVVVTVGGTIPDDDAAELKKLGVAGVFGPGATTGEIVDFIAARCRLMRHREGLRVDSARRTRDRRRACVSVLVTNDGGVALVTIDRQDALNALNVETLTELRDRLRELAAGRHRARRRPHRRRGEGLRRRRRHQVHERSRRRAPREGLGRTRTRSRTPARGDAEADDRRDQRLRARRRLRARARLRHPLRVEQSPARPAGDRPRHRPRLGRHAAPRARLRPRRREGARSSPAGWSTRKRRCGSVSSTQSPIPSSITRSPSREARGEEPGRASRREAPAQRSRPARSSARRRSSATSSRARTRRRASPPSPRSALRSSPAGSSRGRNRRRCRVIGWSDAQRAFSSASSWRPSPPSATPVALAGRNPQVAGLQVALRAHGLYGGAIDAIRGPLTSRASATSSAPTISVSPVAPASTPASRSARSAVRSTAGGCSMRGNVGWDVAVLQFLLVRHGITVPVNGHFGARTLRGVERFQRRAQLSADGIVGPTTRAALAHRHARRTPPRTMSIASVRLLLDHWAAHYGVNVAPRARARVDGVGLQQPARLGDRGARDHADRAVHVAIRRDRADRPSRRARREREHPRRRPAISAISCDDFHGNTRKALAGWYQGERAVRRHGMYRETRVFVKDVLSLAASM